MGLVSLPADDLRRPEFWATMALPFTLNSTAIRAEALDMCTALVFESWAPDSATAFNYLGGALYVGHRADGTPAEPGTEELITSDVNDALVAPATFPGVIASWDAGYARLFCESASNAERITALLIACQVVAEYDAAGGFGATGFTYTLVSDLNASPPNSQLDVFCTDEPAEALYDAWLLALPAA